VGSYEEARDLVKKAQELSKDDDYKLFSAILDKGIRAQAFWQEIANNKTQKTNNNQIQNINDQKIAWRGVGL